MWKKDQYSKIQEIYLERIKELEENLTRLSQKYQKLEQKRNLEVEGFKDEIKRLKCQAIIKTKPELLAYKMEDVENFEKSQEFAKENQMKFVKDLGWVLLEL